MKTKTSVAPVARNPDVPSPRRVPARAPALPAPALLLAVLLVAGCSDADPAAHGGPDAAPPAATQAVLGSDPEAENPDRGAWVDLRKVPFRPEWVGGTLVVIRGEPPETLNNLLWISGDARAWAKHFLCPFLLMEAPDASDGRIGLEPWAADGMPVADADRVTWTWKLKPGMTWEDGRPVTARDYAFTWKLLSNPEVRAVSRRMSLERVAAVEAVDDLVFKVRFKEPYYNVLAAFGLDFTLLPEHATPKDPEEFNRDAGKRSLAFGPYRVARQDAERLVFELRPEYRKVPHPVGPHYVERVEVRFNKDPLSKIQLARAGESHVDVVSHDTFVELARDEAFRKQCWRTYYYLPGWIACVWNLVDPEDPGSRRPHPLLGDVRVRRAMSHLFPRERLREEHFHGLATLVSGPFFFKDADYDRTVPLVPFDPAAAARLLREAGWRLNTSGILEKDGRPFRFTLAHSAGTLFQGPVTLFAEAARRAGIEVEPRPLTREPFQDFLKGHAFDGIMVYNNLSPNIEPDMWELFHSSQAGIAAANWSGLADPAIDRLLDDSRAEFDPAKRTAFRRMLQRRLDEVHPFSFLYASASPVIVSRKWANVKVHDRGILYRDFVWRELWKK